MFLYKFSLNTQLLKIYKIQINKEQDKLSRINK